MFWLKFKHFYILSYSSSQNEIKLEFMDIDGSVGLRFCKQITLDTASQFSGDKQPKKTEQIGTKACIETMSERQKRQSNARAILM